VAFAKIDRQDDGRKWPLTAGHRSVLPMIKSAAEFHKLRCSEHRDDYERASWDKAPLGVWLAIIDEHPEMRFWVAHNKTVPMEILAILARDADSSVRHMVASKNKLSKDLQKQLASDPEFSVRRAVVQNRKVTMAALHILSNDENEAIRKIARVKMAKRQ
jgi:hypothetical protein